MLAATKLCRERGLDVPFLVLLYTTIDALAWAAYGEATTDTRQRFIQFCEDHILPGRDFTCTALELYAARCSTLHSLGWASTLSDSGKARSAFYSFGTDDPATALAAFEHSHPGKFFAIRADVLHEAVATAYSKVKRLAQSDTALAKRLRTAEGKQYRSLESKTGDELFLNYLNAAGKKS